MFVKETNGVEVKDGFNHLFTKKENTHKKNVDMLCIHCNSKIHSSLPLSAVDMFQGPQWMPQTVGSTEPCIYYVFFFSIHSYL